MTEHFCQYLFHWHAGEMAGVFHVASSEYEGFHPPCDKPARFRCGRGWWFCAEHYDDWVSFHGEGKCQ